MNKERAPEPQGWIVARRFQDEAAALRAFEAARDLLLSEDIDASVLRFLLNQRSHVALLGELPLPAAAEEKLKSVVEPLSEATDLPAEISAHLRARRLQFKDTGLNFLERRTRRGPGGGA